MTLSYSSSSRLYERASQHLGMTPDKYRRGAIGVAIRYTTSPSPLGRLLIAATERGVCAIRFGDSDSDLELGLRREYPFAARKRQDDDLQSWNKQVLQHLEGHKLNATLPLDIQATAFQRKVWSYLQTIPPAELPSPTARSPRAIGRPTANPRRSPRLCHQFRSPRNPLSSRSPRGRRPGRLPLGYPSARRNCWNWKSRTNGHGGV